MTLVSSTDTPATPGLPRLVETFFSSGFRPFFLGGAIWACVAMGIWVGSVSGLVPLVDPVSWHVHALLFGYLSAALAGFLLTAVPSWTNGPTVRGKSLACLFGLWVAARFACLGLGVLPALPVAILDLAMPVALIWIAGRAVIRARNWRNVSVLAALILHTMGNAVFHWEMAQGIAAGQGVGVRLAVSAGLLMVSIVGGRIAPNFTRNWLKRQGAPEAAMPPAPSRFDVLCHVGLGIALASWLLAPLSPVTGFLMLLAAVAHTGRWISWQGFRTLSDPLMWVLHTGYAFLPLGAFALGLSLLSLSPLYPSASLHFWTIGALGVTTLAVMTRATLAHSGGPLVALPGTILLYASLLLAAVLRPLTALVPWMTEPLQWVAALGWVIAFGGFAVLYGHRMMIPAK